MWIPCKETIFNSSGGSCTLISLRLLHCFSWIIRYSKPELKRLLSFCFIPPPPHFLSPMCYRFHFQLTKVSPTKKSCGVKSAWSVISLHFMTLSYENTRSRFPSSLLNLPKVDHRAITRPFAWRSPFLLLNSRAPDDLTVTLNMCTISWRQDLLQATLERGWRCCEA